MSTPKEIIEEFEKIEYIFSAKFAIKNKSEIDRARTKIMISEYEEMLGEVEKMKKSDKGIIEIKFGDGTLAKREIDSDMVIGYNKALSDISLLLQSKLKAWRDLIDKK